MRPMSASLNYSFSKANSILEPFAPSTAKSQAVEKEGARMPNSWLSLRGYNANIETEARRQNNQTKVSVGMATLRINVLSAGMLEGAESTARLLLMTGHAGRNGDLHLGDPRPFRSGNRPHVHLVPMIEM